MEYTPSKNIPYRRSTLKRDDFRYCTDSIWISFLLVFYVSLGWPPTVRTNIAKVYFFNLRHHHPHAYMRRYFEESTCGRGEDRRGKPMTALRGVEGYGGKILIDCCVSFPLIWVWRRVWCPHCCMISSSCQKNGTVVQVGFLPLHYHNSPSLTLNFVNPILQFAQNLTNDLPLRLLCLHALSTMVAKTVVDKVFSSL